MSDKLLPCPFCGGELGIQPRSANDFLPHCKNCGAILKPLCTYKTEQKAIAAWNRRTELENKPLTCDGCTVKLKKPKYIWECRICKRNINFTDYYKPEGIEK